MVSGRLKRFRGALTIDNPEFQSVDAAGEVLHGRPHRAGLPADGRADRRPPAGGRCARRSTGPATPTPSTCRPAIRGDLDLPTIATALEAAHYPPDFDARDAALRRLAFDELLALQLGMVGRRRARGRDTAPPIASDGDGEPAIRAALTRCPRRARSGGR